MKITVGMWKGMPTLYNKHKNMLKKDLILSYETERFVKKVFIKHLTNFNQIIKEKFENVKDEEIICIGIDLTYKGKTLLGGCSISGATINATRVSIIEMAVTQLVRQIQQTLKELRKK